MNREKMLKVSRPILFNGEMVRAILEGRKTVTRRLIKPRYKKDEGGFSVCTNKATGEMWVEKHDLDEGSFDNPRYIQPPYQVGDILYVRETFQKLDNSIATDLDVGEYTYVYKASENGQLWESETENWKWKPSIHMPKEAARIFLKVTNIRVERLQDITEEQAIKEGVGNLFIDYIAHSGDEKYNTPMEHETLAIDQFELLWNSTIKKQDLDKYSWEANPWAWVIEFERIEVE